MWRQLVARRFHTRMMCRAPETINVPSMGDSISEGTIVEFAKQVGEAVSPDDVVVTLETDKVSVDVRSPTQGVLTKYFGELDDTVTVGSPLFELDSDATATVTTKVQESAPAPSTPQSSAPPQQVNHSRTPLIQFLGKRDHTRRPPSAASKINTPVRTGTVVAFEQIPASFGHIPISPEEAEAIESGFAML